ncbi:MAG TPA: sugar phosphate isomerase/epimerase family protein [Anaerolineae bacterium]|nr:sugar phosphate isomerase/epimerase family protein [Anaerolineae bacterium]
MLIGWNGETMPALALGDELAVVGSAGYTGLELFIPKLTPFLEVHPAAELARRLEETKLEAIAFNGIENFSFRSPGEFALVEEECRRLARLGQEIRCPTIVVVPSPKPADMGWAAVREASVEALCKLAEVASPYGVRLALEFLAPAGCSVRTLAQGSEIVEATGRDDVGLVLDTYHFFVGGSSEQSLDSVDMRRLFLVHINDVEGKPLSELTDGDRLLPGEGVVPLDPIVQSLRRRGYDGAYSLEVMRPAYRLRDPLEYARAGREAIERVLR